MTPRRTGAFHGLSALAIALAPLLVPAAGARADVARLRNGNTLEITAFRLEGKLIIMKVEGGGEIALPSGQVLEIRRSAASPPETGMPAAEPPRPEAGERLVAPAPSPAPPSMNAPELPRRAADGEVIELPVGAVFDPLALRTLAARIARRHGVDESLVHAVIQIESRYDAFAVSPRGAMGLMQLMPRTAARFAVRNTFDPVDNVEGGVRYLKELLGRYKGQVRLALAAYNAGEQAVEQYSGIPPYRETELYVKRVLREIRR